MEKKWFKKNIKMNSFVYSVTKIVSEITFVEPYKTISCFPIVTNFRPFFLIFLTSLYIKNTLPNLEDLHFLSHLSLVVKTCKKVAFKCILNILFLLYGFAGKRVFG